jgi:hypothetical protein
MDAEIKSAPANGPSCFRICVQIYHLALLLYPNEVIMLGYGQLYILYFAEATTKRLENLSNQRYMAELMQRFDGILRQVNEIPGPTRLSEK